jgi:hypothetical protein
MQQLVGEAEPEDQQLEGFDPQQRDRLREVFDLALHAKERAVDDAQQFDGERRVALDALLERPGVDLGGFR